MLDILWSRTPGLRCIVGAKGKQINHYWFASHEEALNKAKELDDAGKDVYFSPSVFDTDKVEARKKETNPRTGRPYTGREQAAVARIPALWIDMDCGEGKPYADQTAALEALTAWARDNKIPSPTHVVSSGYGLHVYWRLDAPAEPMRWIEVAKHLKQACRVAGLEIDPARTSDSASLLRVPGTHNHKRRGKAPVRVVASQDATTVNLQAFRAALPAVGPLGAVSVSQPLGEWDTTVKHPPGDANKIADKCAQMGRIRFNKGAVEEPVWRAGLSVIIRCKDGDNLIHEWSTGDARYDANETENKAAGTQGPATCRHFAELNAPGCIDCPHAGKVNSPISLAYAEELPESVDEDLHVGVPGYTVTSDGIFKEPLGQDGGPLTKIADFPVWIEDAREHASSQDGGLRSSFLLGWLDVRGRAYAVSLTQAELHDTRAWTTWLANNNLASFVHGPQMQQYISKMHRARYRQQGARVVYDALGWYDNHQLFVIGTQGITADGIQPVVVDTNDPIAELEPCGDLATWLDAIKTFGSPHYYPQAFGLLMGFAAPLLDLVGKNGAVVAFVGQSGNGKTLAAQAGLSVYANPGKIMETGLSTHNALGKYLGQHRHVPALVDEVTTMADKRLRDLIYMAANGADKSSLTQKRERRAAMTWRTVTMLTSNHSIVDRHQKDIEEAHRRRLVEVAVLHGVGTEIGRKVGQTLQKNHGVAAAPYIQLIIKHKDKIPALFEIMEREVAKWGYSEAADRFGAWTCAAALLGGILARAAGLLPFDPVPVVKAIASSSAANNEAILAPHDQAREALFEMLTENNRRICVWQEGKLATDTDTYDPVARINGDMLFVKSSALKDRWHEEHIFQQGLTEWLKKVAPQGQKSVRLVPQTPPVWCYVFRLPLLGWDTATIMSDD